ncbi:MAG: efflux RND transporter permease subunit [Alphaproteobacteria bacterium]|nr:efflux RND transporter permease subunit [Alphaproteobacteria bacterium]
MISTLIVRAITTWMFVVMFSLLGLVSFSRFKIEKNPPLEFDIVTASFIYPSATPLEIENDILKIAKDTLFSITDIKKLESMSYEGVGYIIIEFTNDTNADIKVIEMKNKLDSVMRDFPSSMEIPIVEKYDPMVSSVIDIAVIVDPKVSPMDAYQFVDKSFSNSLLSIKGVASINIIGGKEREIQIQVDPFRLRQYYLTITDIMDLLRESHMQTAAGSFERDLTSTRVRFLGEFDSLEAIEEKEIITQEGFKIKVKDIASVTDTFKKESSKSFLGDQETMIVSVNKMGDGNTIDIAEAVREKINKISTPDGIKLVVAKDTSQYIISETNRTFISIASGLLLTMILLLIFTANLNTLWIAGTQITLTIVSAFFFMELAGFTLNSQTFLALTVAMGPLTSNTLIVIDCILSRYNKMKKKNYFKISIDGVKEAMIPVFASSGTHLAVFIPMVFMEGIVGQYFYPFGMTVIFATFISIAFSLMLTPVMMFYAMHSQDFKKDNKRKNNAKKFGEYLAKGVMKFIAKIPLLGKKIAKITIYLKNVLIKVFSLSAIFNRQKSAMSSLLKVYKRLYNFIFHHKKFTIIVAVISIMASFGLAKFIGGDFIASSDIEEITINFSLPGGSSLERTSIVAKKIESKLKDVPQVVSTQSRIGVNGIENGRINVSLTKVNKRDIKDTELINQWTEWLAEIPDVIFHITRAGGISSNGSFYVNIFADDYRDIIPMKVKVEEIMNNLGIFRSVDSSYKRPVLEIQFIPTQTKVDAQGFNNINIASTLRLSLYGDDSINFKDLGNLYDIRVQVDPFFSDTESLLNIIALRSHNGLIPLNDLGYVKRQETPSNINGRERKQIINVIGYMLPDISSTEAVRLIESELDALQWKNGEGYFFGGSSERKEESFNELKLVFMLALILTFIILAAVMNSLLHPFTIMLSVFSSFSGVFIIMFLTDTTFNLSTMLACMMLIGIVVNGSILLLESVIPICRKNENVNKPIKDILWDHGVAPKFKVIIMTTLAVIISVIPQLFSYDQDKFSMSVVIIGGMMASLIVTFTLTPIIFSALEERFRRSNSMQKMVSRNKIQS